MAKATFYLTFPASGDSFSVANFNNAFNALHQMDLAPLRPRAHDVPDSGIMIKSALVQGFFQGCYASGDFPLVTPSGDIAFSAPAANPRIDLVWMSGDVFYVNQGVEAASPSISRFPSGDGVIPICLVYNRTTQTRIVNYEDQGAYPSDGYIYRDVRPFVRVLAGGLKQATYSA